MPKSNGEAAAAANPFNALQDAILKIGSARNNAERMARVQRGISITRYIETSFRDMTKQVHRSISLLVNLTGGTLRRLHFEVGPDVEEVSCEDNTGVQLNFVAPPSMDVLVLPAHVSPFTVVFVMKDGTTKRTPVADPETKPDAPQPADPA